MSSNVAISLKNVSKIYKIYEKPQDRLLQGFMKGKKFYKEFNAVNNVSLEVKKGETIGLIGRNGSGKSTILQLVAGILRPSSGEVNVNGKVAALLELGSGFNPEFTGKENIFMSGAIIGLTPKEMEERLPEIEKFADIGDFINQPVRTYSSGMFVRLAFACAVNVDPDILIIDEALSVGDMQFQLKCIEKMKSFKKQGKTILFVSHDSYTVRNFCDQAIWMKDGGVYLRGDVNKVTELYQDYMRSNSEPEPVVVLNSVETTTEEAVLTIDSVEISTLDGQCNSEFSFGEKIRVSIRYTLHSIAEEIVGGVAIYDNQQTYICGLNTKLDKQSLPSRPGRYELILTYDEMNLLPGTYFIDVGFFESSAVVKYDYKHRIKSFMVYSGDYFAEGLTLIKHRWENKEVSMYDEIRS